MTTWAERAAAADWPAIAGALDDYGCAPSPSC
jgi:hypothetical protein